MLKKLFILLATFYFIGQATNVLDLFFAGDETAIECTGECENEEEVKETNFDKHFLTHEFFLRKIHVAAPIQTIYYFQSKLISTFSSSLFSPPPEFC